MTRVQLNRFKRALEAKRGELMRAIAVRRDWLAIDHSNDPMEQVRNTADRDLAVDNVDRMCGTLRLVEGALGEIRDGTFGVCANCDEAIPLERLNAVPWSPYCVSCQEQVEQRALNAETAESETPYVFAS
jgi:DnaK suppressor protein